MGKIFSFIGIVFLCCSLCSCATITTGKFQDISVSTTPPGATAICEGKQIITPGIFTLSRSSEHAISITKEGYQPVSVQLRRKLCGSFAGNLILGGIIGAAIDMASGANCKLVPESVEVILYKEEEVTPPSATSVNQD